MPKLGKRLTMIWDLKTQQNIDKQAEFIDELKKNNYKAVVEIAEKYNIEISVAVTPYFIAFKISVDRLNGINASWQTSIFTDFDKIGDDKNRRKI